MRCVRGVLGQMVLVHWCAPLVCCACGALGFWAPVSQRLRVACCVCGAPGYVVLVLRRACVLCCVPMAACFMCVMLVLVRVVCVLVVLCAWCLGVFAASIIPSSLHFPLRPRVGAVDVLVLGSSVPFVAPMAFSPEGGFDALMTDAIFFCLPETLCISWRPRVGMWS